MPIIQKKDRRIVGWVRDIMLSKGKTRIVALIVKEGGWLKETKVLRFKDILSFNEGFIEIKDKDEIKNISTYPELENIITDHSSIIGRDVISDSGKNLGYVVDYIIDVKSGKIFCFILSQGLFDDILDGRQILPYCEGMSVTENHLLINDSLVAAIQDTRTGGLRNLIQ